MKKLFIATLAVALVSALILGGCPSPSPTPGKPIELKVSTWVPPPSMPASQMIDPWIAEVEERTGGRVEITAYHGESLGAADDHYTMVLTGMADIVLASGYTGILLRHGSAFLPFLYTSAEQGGWVHHQMMEEYALDTELKDVKLLWFIPVAPCHLFTTKQVHTLEDLKGMKIAVSGDEEVDIFKVLGAAPILLPVPEVYTSLERGLADGVLDNWEKAFVFKHHEVTKYRTSVGLTVPLMPMFMNLDTWNSLPSDIQEVFDDTTGVQYSTRCGAMFDEAEMMFRGMIAGYDADVGNPEIYDLPAGEMARWIQATAPVHEEWVRNMEAQGIPGQEILDYIHSLVEQYPK
jgi:TRAP-type C4-dicarboxylate transport system substrate-binding protein